MKKWRTFFMPFGFFFFFVQTIFAGSNNRITFWTTEAEQDRLIIQKRIAQEFGAKTGITVQVIPVQENLLREKITAAYAAASLPDVVFHPIDFTIGWATEGVLNINASTTVILKLNPKTFGEGPLNLIGFSGKYAAVPMDGWGQLLLYRKDLFMANGLSVPDTWEHILAAAEKLHKPPMLWGIEIPTDPGQIYTQQVFEHFALSNGVHLVNREGNIDLNTPEMVQTLAFYKSLNLFGPPGNIYWLHTRIDYLSGRTAMTIWSPYILDELSGLRKDQPVVPDMIKKQPGFLARNTGFVAIIKGPDASAQYGQINCLGITRDADIPLSQKWVMYLLTDGYLNWLSMAPEGKLPMRKGTPEAPTCFVDGWKNLEIGTTSRAKISDCFGDDAVAAILSGMAGFSRWGFSQGKGALISKIYGTKIIPKILKRFLDGELTAVEAAKVMDTKVKALE